jgi:phosphohistidine phosphatase
MRHAKSDWNGYYVSDFERTLNKRGLKAAPLMGEVLNAKISPDLIVSSPATRAKMTAEAVAQKLGYPQEKIAFVERIYEASAADLLRIIHRLPQEAEEVLMVGHNPGMTELINALSEDFRVENLPTAGVVGLMFDLQQWSQIAPKKGKVLFFEYPKKYSEAD